MEMDLYKSQFLDGCPDGIWYKNEIIRAGVSNCMCKCLIFFGTKRTHSFVPGLNEEALFHTSKFFLFFSSSFNYINLYKFSNCQMIYFWSLLTLLSVSLPLISPMWHGVTLTLFPKFQYLHEKMFCYLDEKMYLGRWLFPLATFFLQYLLVIIHFGWIELTSNYFHLSHSYMSNWYPTTRLYEFIQTMSALSLYKVTHTNCSVFTIQVTIYQLISSVVTIGVGPRHTN